MHSIIAYPHRISTIRGRQHGDSESGRTWRDIPPASTIRTADGNGFKGADGNRPPARRPVWETERRGRQLLTLAQGYRDHSRLPLNFKRGGCDRSHNSGLAYGVGEIRN
jgi:hypothetical protein